MDETLEINIENGKKARMYGFKIEPHSNLDGMMACPDKYTEYPNATGKLHNLFPKAEGVFVCGNGKDTIVRISNQGVYIELTIEDKYLGKKNDIGLKTVQDFYNAATKIIKDTKVAIGKLNTDIKNPDNQFA